MVEYYAAGEGGEEDEEGGGEPKAFVSVNWLLTEEPLDLETELVRAPPPPPHPHPPPSPPALPHLPSHPVPTPPPPSISPPPTPPQALGFLNYLLLGTSASPLRKALNDSGLGESIVGGGVEDELRQPVFSVGLKVGGWVMGGCVHAGVVWDRGGLCAFRGGKPWRGGVGRCGGCVWVGWILGDSVAFSIIRSNRVSAAQLCHACLAVRWP